MRTYERTHPWINFQVDMARTHPELWLLLGEAKSKLEHLADIPLRPAVQKHFNMVYLAKGALATTAIEGNTLSEAEVIAHLQGKLELPPSKEYLRREIDNIVGAANLIWQDDTGKVDTLSPEVVCTFNRMVLDGLTLDEGVVPGEIRKYSVGVSRYRAAPPEDCEYLLGRYCDWLNGPTFEARDVELRMPTAIMKAILAHLYLAWIHPFGDGNGRTSRLIEVHVLTHAGVPMPAAHLMSNHYNSTRSEYYRQLDQAHQSGGDFRPFLSYAVRGFVDGLREQIAMIKKEQLEAAWRDYVHSKFRNLNSRTARRRELLVLALSLSHAGVPRTKISMLTPSVAAAYAGATTKMLTRDLNALDKMGLVKKQADGYRANRNRMLAFRPHRKPASN